MENPNEPRPVSRVVNTSKKFIILIGVLALVAGVIGLFIETTLAVTLIACGITCFVTGGLVAGLAYITQAAALYIEKCTEEWEAINAQEQAEAPEESEIQ